MPELIFVAGCNAAGKSTFIRTRLNELESFEILMTDVYIVPPVMRTIR